MKQKLLSLLVTLVLILTGVGSVWAQTYKGAKYENGKKYYVMNVGNNSFVSGEKTTSMDIKDALIFTCKVITNNEYLYTDNENRALRADQKGMGDIPGENNWGGRRLRITQRSNNNGDYLYYIKCNTVGIGIEGDGPYLGEDGNRNLNSKSNGKNNNAYTWRLIPVTEAKMFINSSAKYGTFVAPFDITIPEGVTAYTVASATGTSTSDGVVTFSEAGTGGSNLAAGTPVVVYKEGGLAETTFYGVSTITDNIVGSGLLQGVLVDGQTAPKGSYVINYINDKVGFYIVGSENSISVGKNRCYLKGNNTAGGAAKLNIRFEEANAISAVNENATISSIYSASGAKVSSMQKGMNIVKYSDGSVKKVLVK